MRNFFSITPLLLAMASLVTAPLRAQDQVSLAGTWSGTFVIANSDGETKNDTSYLVLKQDGDRITGTAGPKAEEQFLIKDAKLDGHRLTFLVDTGDGSPLHFDLLLDGDHLKGSATGEHDGQQLRAAVDATRT